jgi:hypothetical protein
MLIFAGNAHDSADCGLIAHVLWRDARAEPPHGLCKYPSQSRRIAITWRSLDLARNFASLPPFE